MQGADDNLDTPCRARRASADRQERSARMRREGSLLMHCADRADDGPTIARPAEINRSVGCLDAWVHCGTAPIYSSRTGLVLSLLGGRSSKAGAWGPASWGAVDGSW